MGTQWLEILGAPLAGLGLLFLLLLCCPPGNPAAHPSTSCCHLLWGWRKAGRGVRGSRSLGMSTFHFGTHSPLFPPGALHLQGRGSRAAKRGASPGGTSGSSPSQESWMVQMFSATCSTFKSLISLWRSQSSDLGEWDGRVSLRAGSLMTRFFASMVCTEQGQCRAQPGWHRALWAGLGLQHILSSQEGAAAPPKYQGCRPQRRG